MYDIYLSGEINQDMAARLGYELQWAEPSITIHINSAGGDPFAAIAIGHTIRHADKDITLSVEGLCASAAVLILCSGRRVKSAFNSLFMIHSPSVMLEDSYNLVELEKVKETLEKVQGTIEKTLATRLKEVDLKEQWLSAEEALKIGLIDEIDSAQVVDIKTDAKQKLMFVNGAFFQVKEMPQMTVDEAQVVKRVRAAELSRIRALSELKCGNAAVDAIIDVAINKGRSVSEVKEYVEAIQNAKPLNNLRGLITDQMASGAAGVNGHSVDDKESKINNIAAIANRL